MSGTRTIDEPAAHEDATERLPLVFPDAATNGHHDHGARPPGASSERDDARRASVYLAIIATLGTGVGGVASMLAFGMGWMPGLILTLSTTTLLAGRGIFRTRMVPDMASMISRIISAGAIGSLLALTIIVIAPVDRPTDATYVASTGLVMLSSVIGHQMGTGFLRRRWARGELRSRALVIGIGRLAQELAVEISARPNYGVDIAGFVAAGHLRDGSTASPVIGEVEDICELADRHQVDRLILAPIGSLQPQTISALRRAAASGLAVFVVPRLYEMGLGLDSLSPDRVRGYPLVRLQRAAHPRVGAFLKRSFDVALSGLGLLFALPVLTVAALGVRASGPGGVLFRQARVGQHGEEFELLKLRTMVPCASSDTEWVADERVTTFGRFLRRTAIDELPQLYNVLRGDMSLVGPRPERPSFVEQFRQEVPGYCDRHRMPVGLTGLAQIVGLRGDTSIAERVKYDNIYIDQWTFWSDIQILLKTVWAIFHQGSLSESHVELTNAMENLGVPKTAADH